VHPRRLTRGQAEKGGIKKVHPLQEGRLAGIRLARHQEIRVVQRRAIPAIGRYRTHCIYPIAQQFPESSRVVRPTREATAHTNHRNRLVLVPFAGFQPGLHLLDSQQGPLQGGEVLTVRVCHAQKSRSSNSCNKSASASSSESWLMVLTSRSGTAGAGALSPAVSTTPSPSSDIPIFPAA